MHLGSLLVVVVGTGALCALVTVVGMNPPTWLLGGVAGFGGVLGVVAYGRDDA